MSIKRLIYKMPLLLFVFLLLQFKAFSIGINGSTCVLKPGSSSYSVSGSPGSGLISWCVTGGWISGSSCASSTSMYSITVQWGSGSGGTVSLTTSSGSASLNVTLVDYVNGGSITTNSTQTITYNNIPAGINCSAASGGGCTTPTYAYQWEKSTDNVNWSAESGATGLNLSFSTPLTQTTYYRRLVSVTSPSHYGYSNTATVFVTPQLSGGTIAGTYTINYGTAPGQLSNSTAAGGGNCGGVYTYRWEQSTDQVNFTDIASATGLTYTPGVLYTTTYFRRRASCNLEIAYTNLLAVTVSPQLIPGSISPTLFTIANNTSPGLISGTLPTGGNCGSYSYQWQSSPDGNTYSNISGATGQNYTPSNLTATTYFRRMVTCGTDVQYTNASSVLVDAGTNDLNYIRERTITKAGVTTATAAAALTNALEVQQVTQYFDGLGRPIQTVGMKATPLQKDVVMMNAYDNLGRETKKYLPYVAATSDGNFKGTYLQDQYNFNNIQFAGEQYYYGQTTFEASPLNRPLTQYAPGLNWVGASRGINNQYLVNAVSDSVRIWTIAAPAGSLPASTTRYDAGTLYKNFLTDENGQQVVEYKDRQGKVILKKVQLAAAPGTAHVGWLCTYYIYDALDNLRFVIQPRGVQLINSNWVLTAAIADELGFRYEYDGRKRMIIKRVPGAGEVWMVYDARDRMVMTQDSSLRVAGKWMVTEYDAENRPWRTGLLTNASNRAFHQNLAGVSTSYPSTAANYEELTRAYYDDYTWVAGTGTALSATLDATYTGNSTYFNTSYNASPQFARAITADYMLRGLPTGTKTKVIGTASQFLYTANFFDDRMRMIQTQTINSTSGKDINTMQYDFAGKPIRTLQQHTKSGTNAQTHKVRAKMNYDAGGRLLTIHKNIDDAAADQLIVTNTYNELGQLLNKAEGNNIETLAYGYNIRGWMTSINKNYLSGAGSNYFGMELGYDKTTAAVASTSYTASQYNGNITGTIWKTKGDGVNRKYDFTYDKLNQLSGASFNQNSSGSTWSNALIDFTVSNLSYDANGNILTMNQKGFKVNASPVIDQLSYTYQTNSNKLLKVTDALSDANTKLGDFKDGANGATNDYSYDGNGNNKQDLNKAISGITYNYLNLPNVITVTGKGTITYTYDAAGTKLKKTTVEGAKTTTTFYIGNFVYQNDTLQFIGHEEGRARWAFHKYLNGTTGYKFEYDYFLKDHLGNTRMVLTQQKDTAQYMATLEAAYRNTENQLFYNLQQSNHSRAAVSGYPADATTTPNDSLMKLNGSGQKIGAAIILKVMSGDIVDVAAKAYYTTQTGAGTSSSVTNVLSSFANGIVNVAGGAKGGLADLINTTTSPLFSAINSFVTANNPTIASKPRAYLNWILLDEQLQYVNSYPQSGAVAVGNTTTGTLNTLGYTGIPINKNGYLYIYVNNETQGWDVFFDNLAIKHYTGPILEETHYYPFGLTMAGISSRALKNAPENKYKFNDATELNNDFDLGIYETPNRVYDPQIGRFLQIDEFGEIAEEWSPFVFAYNNPILFNDPLGLFTELPKETSTPEKPKELPGVTVVSVKGGLWAQTRFYYRLTDHLKSKGATIDNIVNDKIRAQMQRIEGIVKHRERVAAMTRASDEIVLEGASWFAPTGWVLKVFKFRRLAAFFKLRRGKTTVYVSKNADGVVQYIGITDDLARRAAEHLSQKGIDIVPLMTKLTRSEARAVEQVLIEMHGLIKNGGTLLNKINSIAKTNPDYAKQLTVGLDKLLSIGYVP